MIDESLGEQSSARSRREMNAIAFRKENRISRRTLGLPLVCKVIGSLCRSRFARARVRWSPRGPSAGTLPRERHDSAITRCRVSQPSAAAFLSSIYVSIPLSTHTPRPSSPEDDPPRSPCDLYTDPAGRASEQPRNRGAYPPRNSPSTAESLRVERAGR